MQCFVWYRNKCFFFIFQQNTVKIDCPMEKKVLLKRTFSNFPSNLLQMYQKAFLFSDKSFRLHIRNNKSRCLTFRNGQACKYYLCTTLMHYDADAFYPILIYLHTHVATHIGSLHWVQHKPIAFNVLNIFIVHYKIDEWNKTKKKLWKE